MPGAKLWSSRTRRPVQPGRVPPGVAVSDAGAGARSALPEALSCGDSPPRAVRSGLALEHPAHTASFPSPALRRKSVGPGERRAGLAHLMEVSSARRAMCCAWGMLIHLSKTSTRGSRRFVETRAMASPRRTARFTTLRPLPPPRPGDDRRCLPIVPASAPASDTPGVPEPVRRSSPKQRARTSGAPDRFRSARVNGPLSRPGCAFRR